MIFILLVRRTQITTCPVVSHGITKGIDNVELTKTIMRSKYQTSTSGHNTRDKLHVRTTTLNTPRTNCNTFITKIVQKRKSQ